MRRIALGLIVLALILSGCQPIVVPDEMSGAGTMMDSASAQQAAETLVERYLEELWNQGNLAVADELVAESFVSHNAPPGEGLGFLKEIVAGYKAENPNIYFRGGEVVLTEDGVIAVVTMLARPEGAAADAEGEQIGDPMLVVLNIRDGKITDRWLYVVDE